MVTPKVFDISAGTETVFSSDVNVKGIDFVACYISTTGLQGSYKRVSVSDYQLINNSIVFTFAPVGKFLRIVVSTNRTDLLSTPTDIATVAQNMDSVVKVSTNIDKLIDLDMVYSGNGSPEGAVGADLGSIYTNLDGGVGTTLWIKETETGGNKFTGWASK